MTNKVRVFYTPQAEGSRCLMFLAQAWVELMQAGLWSRREVLVTGVEQVVYAVANKRVVGVLAFHVDESGLSVVSVGYVLPEFRGQHVYRQLRAAYETKSRQQGTKYLVTICQQGNTPIQNLCKSQGYVCHSQEWRKAL